MHKPSFNNRMQVISYGGGGSGGVASKQLAKFGSQLMNKMRRLGLSVVEKGSQLQLEFPHLTTQNLECGG
jgi:hypothetical protein